MGDNDDISKDFLVESYENLDQMDQDFVALEKDPANKEVLANIFRTIHTIKGTCGFLGFGKLESVTHEGESLLDLLREGNLKLSQEITSGLLSLVDAVRIILASIEKSGLEGEGDYAPLAERLRKLQTPGATPEPAPEPEPIAAPVPQPEAETPKEVPVEADPHAGGVSEGNIRVDVGLLDKLMNLVGELVLARNQIIQYSNHENDSAFTSSSQRLNLITTELQEGVMKTRMQPIGILWSRLPRVVRDLALSCGKQVKIDMEGSETELDKTVLEAIKDPLMHIVRNSVDHGLENPEDRKARGKNPEGRLSLRAFHEGGQVNIQISDDGGGINSEKVKEKALQKTLITNEQASRMGEREILNLIFMPGFSTAEKITNISGRGVGMDVVKTNIEKIGGMIDIQSRAGKGTSIRIKIPLTLAIIPALIVTSAGDRFAIPQVSLLELVRLEENQANKSVEMINGFPVYRLRGHLLPLIYLNKELKTDKDKNEQTDETKTSTVNMVVLQANDRQFGLVVDDINDTQEIVVKPLGKQLKGVDAFAGATIMGDGNVALILDVVGIAQSAGVVSELKDKGMGAADETKEDNVQEKQSLLLFKVGAEGRMAIPLSSVARLEEFPRESVEKAGLLEVVQYRGQIMPLVRLSKWFANEKGNGSQSEEAGKLQVVVYAADGKSVGIVVENILDIVDENITVQSRFKAEGVEGAAVVQQKVTDILDIDRVLKSLEYETVQIEKGGK